MAATNNEAPKVEKEQGFTPESLIESAAHFDTTPEIMAGALYGVKGKVTQTEARTKVKEFLKQEVAPKDKEAK